MIKRLLSLLLALMTVCSMAVPAYAEAGKIADVPEMMEAAEEVIFPVGLIGSEENVEPETPAALLPVDEPEVLSTGADEIQTLTTVQNGLVKDADGVMRYYTNGKVDTSKKGVAQLADKSSGNWYYVEKGVFAKKTGIAQRADKSNTTWYYIKDGVYTKATGIAQKADGSSSAWYYVQNGQYVKKTGIAQKADKSSSAWYYVKNGVYTKATGIAQKADGSSSVWYYVQNGQYVKKTGVAQKADKSSSAWYYVQNGQHAKKTGLAQRADGSNKTWYYVQNGSYLKTYTGLAPRISDGKLFYVKNGAYLSTYSGDVTYNGKTYTVKNGAAVVTAGTAGGGYSDSTTVYVSNSGHKIHRLSDCSGMKYYTPMTLSEAESNGYAKCKVCFG